MRSNRNNLAVTLSSALLLGTLIGGVTEAAAQRATLRHIYGNSFEVVRGGHPVMGVHRLQVHPGFKWPNTRSAAYAASDLPKKDVLRFLASGLGWAAGDMPNLGEFRFAVLGSKEVCLVARWHLREAAMQEVVCPAKGGGYWDASLSHSAPGPLAWYVVDLKGSGHSEVLSSRGGTGAYAAPPIYWYTIYDIRDGFPRDISSQFPEFYKAAFLPQLSAVERILNPPMTAQSPPPKWAPYENLVLEYMRLKYERSILGQKKAGLEQGLSWVKSPYDDVQGLGVEELGAIPGSQSAEALRALGAKTRNLGTCVDVANALRSIGAISDAEHTQRIGDCDKLKPTHPCLLQTGCVAPKRR